MTFTEFYTLDRIYKTSFIRKNSSTLKTRNSSYKNTTRTRKNWKGLTLRMEVGLGERCTPVGRWRRQEIGKTESHKREGPVRIP